MPSPLGTRRTTSGNGKAPGRWWLAPMMASRKGLIWNGSSKATKYTIRLDGVSNQDPYMIKLNASQKQVDVFHHWTPPGTSGGKLKGIYEVSSDSLTVCYDLTDQAYPKSFEAKRGSRQVLYQFRRE